MKYLLTAWLLLFALPATAADCMPHAGERLVFGVGWEFINAGTATMNVSSMGESGYRIHTLAATNKFFDVFKKVRDTILSEGICRNGAMQSTRFDIEQHERNYHAKKGTAFEWQKNRVAYTQNNKTDYYDVPAGHLNVMDAFFKVRGLDLKPGMTVTVPVFDSRKIYSILVTVSDKTENMKAPWGGHAECLVVEPQLLTAGVFSSTGKIKIWMTNDARHIPLKMTAAIKIGHIVAVLDEYKAAP